MHSNCLEENLTFFLQKKLLHIRTLRKKSQNCIQLVAEKLFFSEEKYYSSHFRCLTKIFSAFCSKIFSKLFRTAFFVSRGTSCDFFAEKNLSILDKISTMAKFSRQAWQNWVLSVHGNFLKEFDSAKINFFFMVSGHRAKPARCFEEKFSAGLSKLHLRDFRRNTLIEHIPWRS